MKYLGKDVQAMYYMGQPVLKIYHMGSTVWSNTNQITPATS